MQRFSSGCNMSCPPDQEMRSAMKTTALQCTYAKSTLTSQVKSDAPSNRSLPGQAQLNVCILNMMQLLSGMPCRNVAAVYLDNAEQGVVTIVCMFLTANC